MPSMRSTAQSIKSAGGTSAESAMGRTHLGIMWVTFGHLRPSGHIMPDHAGDRGAVLLVLAPHDHLHIKQIRAFSRGPAELW